MFSYQKRRDDVPMQVHQGKKRLLDVSRCLVKKPWLVVVQQQLALMMVNRHLCCVDFVCVWIRWWESFVRVAAVVAEMSSAWEYCCCYLYKHVEVNIPTPF